jgi:mRNA interferase MazF
MPIAFHPHPGTVLICDFSTGFQPPEMVNVGTSSSCPRAAPTTQASAWWFRSAPLLPILSNLPSLDSRGRVSVLSPAAVCVAKGDMLTCVGFRRLDRVLLNGRYVAPSLQPNDFAAIQRAILAALEIRTP